MVKDINNVLQTKSGIYDSLFILNEDHISEPDDVIHFTDEESFLHMFEEEHVNNSLTNNIIDLNELINIQLSGKTLGSTIYYTDDDEIFNIGFVIYK